VRRNLLLVRQRELLKPLLTALAVLALAVGFAGLGSEVREGETHAFDMAILQQAMALRADRHWLPEVMRDLSGLGSTTVMTLLAVTSCGYLWLVRRRLHALLVGASIGSAALLVGSLKAIFGRSRPDSAFAAFVQAGLSFPSGHASMSAVVYLTMGALLASTRERVSERVYILATAALFTLLVGISRVALGVHWATDVFGGWAFGTAWAVLWLLIAAICGLTTRMARAAGPLR
jgi:undecaprenyl-diphosphatase